MRIAPSKIQKNETSQRASWEWDKKKTKWRRVRVFLPPAISPCVTEDKVGEWMNQSIWMNGVCVSETNRNGIIQFSSFRGEEKIFLMSRNYLLGNLHQLWTRIDDWHLNLCLKEERQILRGPQKHKVRRRKRKLRWCFRGDRSWDPRGHATPLPAWAQSDATYSILRAQIHKHDDHTRKERRAQVGGRQNPVETGWRRVEGCACNVSCGDPGEGGGARQHSWGQGTSERETQLGHRDKLLTLRFGGSAIFKQIKKQGKGQQGTVSRIKKIKKQNVITGY